MHKTNLFLYIVAMIPKRSWLEYGVLLTILIILSVIFYRETIFYFPSHIHAWTQSDRYAIALQFLQNGFNLFKPRTFNLQTIDGVTAVDLPIHEWLVALWMKIVGSKAPGIFRMHVLAIAFLGYGFLFLMVKKLSDSVAKSILAVIFVFSCPVLTYYQAGFIPSTTSLATALAGYYFVVKYWDKKNLKDFYWAVGCLCLAALIRKPFIIFLFAFFLHQACISFFCRKINVRELVAFGISFLLFVGLQIYNLYLSSTYGNMFLSEIMPARSGAEFQEILENVYHVWRWQYFTRFHYIVFALILILALIQYIRKIELSYLLKNIIFQSVICLAGGLCYFLLMARQFIAHEYYFIDSLYVGCFLLFIGCLSYVSFSSVKIRNALLTVISLLMLGACWDSTNVQKEKYSVMDRGEITRHNFTGAEQWLDALEIPSDARILVLDAYSTNAPLILMNRQGYTVLITRDSTIREALDYDFDYVVIQDEFIPSEIVTPYPGIVDQLSRVAGNGKISLFRHKPDEASGTLKGLLGIKSENIRFSESLDFSTDSLPNWEVKSQIVKIDTTNTSDSFMGILAPDQEFGPTFGKKLPEQEINRLLIEARLERIVPTCLGKIAVSIQNGDELVYYKDYSTEMYHNDWQNVQFLYKLPAYIPPNSVLKCYLWNPNKCSWHMDYLSLTAYED